MMDAASRMKGVEPSFLMTQCKTFLGEGWKDINENNFDFRVLTLGCGNRLFYCRAKENTVTPSPPHVLVRLLGGNMLAKNLPSRVLTEASESVVFFALSERGWAPKLHGVFEGGRIEEFIPSRFFTIDEFCDDVEISASVARVMARYHTMDLPIPRTQVDWPAFWRKHHAQHLENIKNGLPKLPLPVSDQQKKAIDALINFDVTAEANWLERVEKQVPTRIVFTHNDVNRSNTLVRLEETASNGRKLSWVERIVLIDYEFSSYKSRGVDIGKHFGLQVHDFGHELALMHKKYPSEQRRRAFISAYADECKRLGTFDNWDETGTDSIENMLIEPELGAISGRFGMIAWLQLDFVNLVQMMDKHKDKDPEFTNQGGAASFVPWYQERKAEFLLRYPQFV